MQLFLLFNPYVLPKQFHFLPVYYHWIIEGSLRCVQLCYPVGLQPARLLCPWNFPERMLDWVAIAYSKGSSWTRDQTCVSCIGRQLFITEPSGSMCYPLGICYHVLSFLCHYFHYTFFFFKLPPSWDYVKLFYSTVFLSWPLSKNTNLDWWI